MRPRLICGYRLRAFLHMGDFGFKFSKRRQLIVGSHNETLSVAAMRVSNPDRSASLAHTDRVRIVFDCRTVNERRLFYRRFLQARTVLRIRVYDNAGRVIKAHEHKGDFIEW